MAEAVDKKETTNQSVPMVTLTIDGRSTSVPKGTSVLVAAKEMGINIPTFCWHPKLKSVGACRICYVEIEKMGKLQVSCATDVMEGMVVRTDTDTVKQGRKAVLEFILANHPLDCPTCDKGGECDLQNLTFAHGVDDNRFEFQKARFVDDDMTTTFDDLKIGPEIVLNRNRCILCYKCVRSNKDIFGEYDLGAFERGNITEINAAPGEAVDNPFSGNLVEICPVGALTSSDWRYQIRVWLTGTVPSICNFHSSGTNVLLTKEDHKARVFRTTSRCNDDIDDGWLSDVTRYGYQMIHSADRLQAPLIKKEGKQVPATWDEALEVIGARCGEITEKMGRVCIGGLVAPYLDNATLHGFSKLFRTVLKSNNVDYRFDYRMLPNKADAPFSILGSRPFTIADIDDSDVIVSFGSDLLREHPNEYLRIRKAAADSGARVFAINPYSMKSGDVANLELVYKPGTDEVVLNGLMLAAMEENLVDSQQAGDLKSKIGQSSLSDAARISGVDEAELRAVAKALADGKKVTFFFGELIARSRSRDTIAAAAANLNRLFGLDRKGQFAVLARYSNSMGARRLGLAAQPSAAVIERMKSLWGAFPDTEPKNTDEMMVLSKKEEISGLFVFGTNPIMLYPDRDFAKEAFEKVDFLVVADIFETETTAMADVVLPLSSWAECDGDYVNLEGKVQKTEAAIKPLHQSKPGAEIVGLISETLGTKLFESQSDCQDEIDSLMELDYHLPFPAGYLELKATEDEHHQGYDIPVYLCDDTHHSDYRTEKSASLLNFTGEPYIEMSPSLAAEYKLKDGDSVRVESPTGKIIVPARISEHIDNNVTLLPRNFSSVPVNSLFMRKRRVDYVKISKVDE